LWAQSVYFLVTGLWPLISIHTFILVTGPKTDHLPTGREADHWLVMTAGVLITSVALSLLVAAWNRRASAETITVAIGAAAGLTAIDIIYVYRGVIQPIYLLDGAIEIALLMAWALVLLAPTIRRQFGCCT
jgi:hypothetical protein